jgi:hypothetical protein
LRGRGSQKSEDAGENGQGTEKPIHPNPKINSAYGLIAAIRSSAYMTGATTYEAPPTVMVH